MMTFEEVRAEYERQREQERRGLANYLKKHSGIKAAGLHVVTCGTAGRGDESYTSRGQNSCL